MSEATKIISESTLRAFMDLIVGELKEKSDIDHSHLLSNLTDVDTTNIENGNALKWNQAERKWEVGNVGLGGEFDEYTAPEVLDVWRSIIGEVSGDSGSSGGGSSGGDIILENYATIEMLQNYAKLSHIHSVSEVTGLQDFIDTHTHEIADIEDAEVMIQDTVDTLWGEISGGNSEAESKLYVRSIAGKTGDVKLEIGDIENLLATLNLKAEKLHSHTIADIEDLQSSLDSKADVNHTHSQLHTHTNQSVIDSITEDDIKHWDREIDYNELTNVPEEFTPESHKHDTNEIYGLDGILSQKAEIVHTHVLNDIQGLQGSLNSKSNVGHLHDVSDISNIEEVYYNKAEVDGLINGLGNNEDINLNGYATIDMLNNYAELVHTHTWEDLTNAEMIVETIVHNMIEEIDHTPPVSSVAGKEGDITLEIEDILNLTSALEGKSNIEHVHGITEIPNLQAILDSKALTNHYHEELHTHANKDVLDAITSEDIERWNNQNSFSGDYNDLTNIPTEFVPSDHTHSVEDITNIQTVLDTKANIDHIHYVSEMIHEGDKVTTGQVDTLWYG